MVKILAVVVALAAAVAPVAADNCKPGLYYCGHVLLQLGIKYSHRHLTDCLLTLCTGRYYPQIVEALVKVGSSTDANHVNHSLFYCKGGANGDIYRVSYCSNGCHDGGRGRNDYC